MFINCLFAWVKNDAAENRTKRFFVWCIFSRLHWKMRDKASPKKRKKSSRRNLLFLFMLTFLFLKWKNFRIKQLKWQFVSVIVDNVIASFSRLLPSTIFKQMKRVWFDIECSARQKTLIWKSLANCSSINCALFRDETAYQCSDECLNDFRRS